MNLGQLLASSAPDMEHIRTHLDGLSHPQRLAETRELGRGPQRKLYDAAKGFMPIDLDYLVPADRPPMREVVHHGRNTLPTFNLFAKVFVRPDGAEADRAELWGYNRNSQLLETSVGPGYFVAHTAPGGPHDEGEVLVDYLRLPPRAPNHWPAILPNSARLSKVVYHHTRDVLRGVSRHVTIGRATKEGQELPAWFILCRHD